MDRDNQDPSLDKDDSENNPNTRDDYGNTTSINQTEDQSRVKNEDRSEDPDEVDETEQKN